MELHEYPTVYAAVEGWLEDMVEPGYSMKKVIRDLCENGCESGMVGGLIYYHETIAFYEAHRVEIAKMLAEDVESFGVDGAGGLFGDKWDKDDPLAGDTMNRNLLAWYAFEREARTVADSLGVEV